MAFPIQAAAAGDLVPRDRVTVVLQNCSDYGEDMMIRSRKRLLVFSFTLLLGLGGVLQVPSQGRRAKVDPEFTAFWIKFKAALARNDKAAVADMTKLPFMFGSKELDRAGFIKQYSSLFTPSVRRCFARAKPSQDQDAMEIFCGEEIFLFAKVGGTYKFTEIGVND